MMTEPEWELCGFVELKYAWAYEQVARDTGLLRVGPERSRGMKGEQVSFRWASRNAEVKDALDLAESLIIQSDSSAECNLDKGAGEEIS